MSDELRAKFDSWLTDTGPAALVIREYLMPVEGTDGVVFPATYAASQDGRFDGGYNIDSFNDSGTENVCLIDSVGSQANRIEPLFIKPEYADLVPLVTVKAGVKVVNLLEAGHRAGDAIARCSELHEELHAAFIALQNGEAEQLAKIAPTSLVFGVWDSRDTQAKLPRLVVSTIRAFNVRPLTRSANFLVQQRVDYVAEGLLADPTDQEKKQYSKWGYLNALASATHGGVIPTGGIRRDASLHLAALRLLNASSERTLALRRYILGLALTAFTYPPTGYLRQGCNLVLDPDRPREFIEVYGDGRRQPASVTHAEAFEYARAVTNDFGVGRKHEVEFDRERAKRDVSGDPEKEGKVKKSKNPK